MSSRRFRKAAAPGLLALVTAAALLAPIATTAAAERQSTPAASATAALPALIQGPGEAIHPEGFTWDPTRRAFLIGSLRHGTISVVGADGIPHTLVSDPSLIATGGIRVDATRNRLLATYGDVYAGPNALLSDGSTPETRGRYGGVAIFNLTTGALEKRVELSQSPGLHLANDLALDPQGNAYATDSFTGTIFKVTPAGTASVLLKDPALDAGYQDGLPNVGVNGILYHPSGALIVVRYDSGALFRIPLDNPSNFREISLTERIPGADGIALGSDGTLYAATNTIRSNGIDGLFKLRSSDGWRSAGIVSKTVSPEAAPTTVTLTPSGAYVLSSNVHILFGSGGAQTRDGFALRRF
ncbi:SMP-30/gluconolactonase/LRE family protein [Streptomyces sp. NPDC054961]